VLTHADDVGCSRGISFIKAASEGVPEEILIQGSMFENIGPVEDGDAIAYQGWAQTTLGNVIIDSCHFRDCAKRALKALSPGGTFSNCDIYSSRVAASPMHAAISINTSHWKVIGNRAVTGARGYGCEVGNTEWACENVEVIGNTFNQGSDPYTSGRGVKVFGGAGTLTTGVTIAGNVIGGMQLGVFIAGGVVGCAVTGNYAQATETAYHIGQRDSGDSTYADSIYVTVSGNVFSATTYGVRWKQAAHCTPGINVGTAGTPFSSEQTYTTQFDDLSLYRLNIIGGTLTSITAPALVGRATAVTFNDANDKPQIQASATSALASLSADVNDGTRNRRARLLVDDTNAEWGLDATYASAGQIPFRIKIGGTTYLYIDGAGKIRFGSSTAPAISFRTSTPEGALVGNPGDMCINTSGGAATTLFVKESGTGNTGWIGK